MVAQCLQTMNWKPSDLAYGALAQMNLAELFSRYPQTIPIFNRHGLACAGCEITAFETIAQAIAIYQLDANLFLAELDRVMLSREEK